MPFANTPAQNKLFSAVAHGWKPPAGSKAAKLPVSVAKEGHALSTGKYAAKHKGTAGPKVADKYKRQYHREAGTPYHGYGGGISMGKARPMPLHEPPEVTAWPMEHRQPAHMRDGVAREWQHEGGYRSADPDHPQVFPHNQARHGDGYVRHVARMSYPSPVSCGRHMQGCTSNGHQIGARSAGGGHTFRGVRTRHGK